MSWETLRGLGNLYRGSFLENAEGVVKARDLLYQTIRSFAEKSDLFYKKMGWLPFTYSEKQTRGILLPAIAETAEAVFTEQPVRRRGRRGAKRYGYLDYWVYHRDALFIIELKQGWHSWRSKHLRKSTCELWKDAVTQISNIDIDEIRGELGLVGERILRGAMMIVCLYQSCSTKKKPKALAKEDVLGFYNVAMKELSPRPNWGAAWLLHENQQVDQIKSMSTTDYDEYYPAVLFLCSVHRRGSGGG